MSSYNLDPIKKYMNDTLYDLIKRISINYNLDVAEMASKYNIQVKTEEIAVVTATPKKKRAPSTKKKTEIGSSSKTIEMYEICYKDVKYLMDKSKNVYTFDPETPKLMGQMLANSEIKFIV